MIEYWMLPLMFLAALAAGFVDAIAGGGGLITLPVLLSCGLPAPLALGTNKLQSSFGSGAAAWHYMRGGAVCLEDCHRPFIYCFAGAAAGALSVQFLHPELLKKGIPALLIAVGLYMLFQPKVGETDLHPRLNKGWFDFWFGLGIGFYDGFLGPGTGTFWTIAYVTLQGYNLTRATAHTKVMNFASNLSALLLFAIGGKVLLLPGVVMGAGQLLGARLGARMVLARGVRFIRPVFLAVVLIMTIKLLADAWRV